MLPCRNSRQLLATMVIAIALSFESNEAHATASCSEAFAPASKQQTEVKDLKSFGQAMTEGMLLNSSQDELFEIYRKIFFGDPNTSVNSETLKSVTQILEKHPELKKPHFREYEISAIEKVYESPDSLNKYLRSQVSIAGQVRSNLLQIEANLGFWKRVLDYQDASKPEGLSKEQQKDYQRIAKERFENYLNRLISKANRELLSDLKNGKEDYQKKSKALFLTLNHIQLWMAKKGRDTSAIRQAMVDLVHTVGFGNEATQALLKSKNALDRIEGLKKILDERDAVAMDLGYVGHFEELQKDLGIEFPTGLSKNEDPNQNIQKLEEAVLAGSFTTKPMETIRVRSLSIQEAPFRSCLGGSDCSTRTYFSKALDPNFIYFTMTDSENHSDGHVTVVLGEAKNSTSGKMEKVGLIDKLQNIPNKKIQSFLLAVSMSLSEKGYKLVVPADVGGSSGLSNMATIRDYVAQEILSQLDHKLTAFVPHPHQYSFQNGYSRSHNKLDVRIYEPPSIDADTKIRPGREYTSFVASQNLDKNKLIKDLLELKNSSDPADVQKYISSGQAVAQFEKLGLYSIQEFQKDLARIIERKDLSFNIRKQAAIEAVLLLNETEDDSFAIDFRNFEDAERTQISSEIRQWTKSSDKRKKKFADGLTNKWALAVQNGDINTLEAITALKIYDINFKNESGFSTLLQAGFVEQRAVIEWLIQKPNLDLTLKDEFGFTDVEQLRLLGRNDIADYIEIKRKDSRSRRFEVKERNTNGTPIVDFVKIHPGKFKMGDGDSKVSVTLTKTFEVMSTHTTQKTWKSVIDLANLHLAKKLSLSLNPSKFRGEQNPVERVTHVDVSLWIEALNELSKLKSLDVHKALEALFPGHRSGDVYRLPTEAEWEYVARVRGLANGKFSHSDTNARLGDYAWYDGNSKSGTHPVGLKKPIIINGKPIYDIHGNVWEWTNDWFGGNLPGGVDPQGPTTGTIRVHRGGSWSSFVSDLSSDVRLNLRPGVRFNSVGFRLVRSAR